MTLILFGILRLVVQVATLTSRSNKCKIYPISIHGKMKKFAIIIGVLACILSVTAQGRLNFFRTLADTWDDFELEASRVIEEIYEDRKIRDAIDDLIGRNSAFNKVARAIGRDMDFRKYRSIMSKAFRDAAFKDLSKAFEKVDFEPIKGIALEFLNVTRDVIKDVEWESVIEASHRISNATSEVVQDISNHLNEALVP